ncbi:sigma-54-dependent transcriptional regulator [Marinobacter sp. X15-166B]|uniref:sigma-54-dependent transcriptional regulator n=1 Tax=Marinobacter sp. X15-166B TaxID=1897620 RepID=UPI00085C12E4|nr:sigma-54 dependent transcriptional regulator [Marinobacter sp. X15-166B]OEY67042.1 hypothetical protein BG841_11635 [Marinobacter sp. X15-166B]
MTLDSTANQPVFFIDDDLDLLEEIAESFGLEGYPVSAFCHAEDALKELSDDWPGVIVSDLRMAGLNGHQFLDEVQRIDPDIPFIMITGYGEIKDAISAVKTGAFDFLEKPVDLQTLGQTLRRAHDQRSLVLESRKLQADSVDSNSLAKTFIGRSEAAIEVRKNIGALAAIDIDALVIGETGTGKDVVAGCLHEFSTRRNGPFIAVNCGALPDTLVDSAFFGHERGAFTGAENRHLGYFERAHQGTLFLDELESMPLELQARLLRVLESRSIERLGSNDGPKQLDVRVIAAVKGDVNKLVAEGRLRSDLVYRLNVASISLPPLRERQPDIDLLFLHFCRLAATAHNIEFEEPTQKFLDKVRRQAWPGNVRELRNFAERFVVGLSPQLDVEQPDSSAASSNASNLDEALGAFEKRFIADQLKKTNGAISSAAELMEIPRKRLYLRMKKYGLLKERFRG